VLVNFLTSFYSAAGIPPEEDPCDHPIYTGPCKESFTAYAFDKTIDQCVEINGACQDFPIFISLETCQITCEDICYKKIGPGNCSAYAYNKNSLECEFFDNRDCKEDGNYFAKEKACEEECESVLVNFLTSFDSAASILPEEEPCNYPIYTGPCNDSFTAYAFDQTRDQCVEINGACQGFPYFISLKTCEKTCEDVCYKKIGSGNCSAYAYNKNSLQCELFDNRDCKEDGNYFKTEKACEEECENVCNKRIAPGDCEAYVPSYGYDKTRGECVFFVYGGCGGNANRFGTKDKCEETCEDDPCKMLIDKGPCDGIFPKFGYNKTSGQCEYFEYGGCKGNANNFDTLERCENQCIDICNRPMVVGNCKASIRRYFFNKATGQCEVFYWGGCGGNGNKFYLLSDCEDKCEGYYCRIYFILISFRLVQEVLDVFGSQKGKWSGPMTVAL
ncbi:Papilin, partial [Armadillidium vulgare]